MLIEQKTKCNCLKYARGSKYKYKRVRLLSLSLLEARPENGCYIQ